MTGETGAERRVGRIPLGLAGMIVLVALCEVMLSQNPIAFARPEQHEWAWCGRAARQEATRAQILCFGSSMSAFSLIPEVIQRESGRSVYNLSLCVGPPAAEYFLLRRALEAGARPSLVVLELHPSAIKEEPAFAVKFWPQLLTPREALELCWNGRDPGLFASVVAAGAFPSIRNREQIRSACLHAVAGRVDPVPIENRMMIRNRQRNAGALLQPVRAYIPSENVRFRNDLLPAAWRPSPTGSLYARRFLDLAQAHGIPVLIHLPPFEAELQAERARKGLDRAFAELVARYQSRYPNLTVVDGLRAGYPREAFCDPVHLNRRGAVAYSRAIGRLLATRLDAWCAYAPRWVALEPYGPASEGDLEDLLQSRAIVLADDAKVRR